MKNLKTLYNFHDSSLYHDDDKLLLEVSDTGMSLMRYNESGKQLSGVSILQFGDTGDFTFGELISKYSAGISSNNIAIFVDCQQSLLVPILYHHSENNKEMLELAFGNQQYRKIAQDNLYRSQMVHVFSIPLVFDAVIKESLPSYLEYSHSTSTQLATAVSGSQIRVIFFYNRMKVFVFKDSGLQLSKYFDYIQPEDVLYHLVNLCKQMALQPEEIALTISGLIAPDSALYAKLYDYFGNMMIVEHTDWNADLPGMKELPLHFFSHLISLATCE